MTVIFTKTISMEMANTFGPTEESTMDNGLTIKWKAREHLHGVTDVDT